ncbi:uracil-DNA glycosylase [Geodermatophilus sp. DSM 45219]|uniref:uracil-DNA glycosylase n=1 Tax=Geodermatophilus sp. DSM 45219 TaxID=1881103 RepID=UPI0008803D74|nr:uracil-DNA glycosylase [Geodermatophilus sp. DSM 45219]SDO47600.1 Uracil DNA glycosylase superfamily protein [Geodermatophilus sp. DSM 45219]
MSAPPRVRGVRNRLAYAEGTLLDERIVPGSVTARHARLGEPHVAELNRWARDVAAAERRRVPFLDPESGGAAARVLVLLQDPSEVAAHGSRLISRHNNDMTAANTHRISTEVGLPHATTVHWNVVPWWVADPAIPAGERLGLSAAARRARPHLGTLLGLLPDVRVVVLLGRLAQQAWDASGLRPGSREVLRAPHPSPQAIHQTDPATGRRNGDVLRDVLAEAAAQVR